MEEDKFDCIIVGGGVAGCAAAYILAQNNLKILLIEKGEWTGSKNVSGGVCGPNCMGNLFLSWLTKLMIHPMSVTLIVDV